MPTVGVGSRVAGLIETLEGKFPFSLAAGLGSFFGGEAGAAGALPGSIGGFITLPWADVSLVGFFAVVKVAVTLLIGASLVWLLVDRLTPQVTI